jgi:antitoxin component of RelBE/YafQ-DinJ toxin-antitoxin module
MKGYEKYFPQRDDENTVLIQAKIKKSLHEQAKDLLDKENLTWHDCLTGLLTKLVDDSKKKVG